MRKKKKAADFADEIQKLMDDLGFAKQSDLAKRLGVSEPTISSWLKGNLRRPPSTEAYFRMAMNARTEGLAVSFLERAGLDARTIHGASAKLSKYRSMPPIEGDVVRVPRYGQRDEGMQEVGPPVPLPAEFIPNPKATICFVVDQKTRGVVDSPVGTFILDQSIADAESFVTLWDQVLLVECAQMATGEANLPAGAYVGRLILGEVSERREEGNVFWPGTLWQARLKPLSQRPLVESLRLATARFHPPDGTPAYATDLAPSQLASLDKFYKESRQRARAELRIERSHRILGQVIGRLSGNRGHLRMAIL